MNTNPDAIKILCYGDSNTWGQKPDKSGRYTSDVRWTGQLQKLLGNSHYIIEEGLGSRTTDLDYDKKPGRNGKTYLIPCLASHNPLDAVIIMLGTNDLKTQYNRTAEDIADTLEGLAHDIQRYAKNHQGAVPSVILISPMVINDNAPRFAEFYTDYYSVQSTQESYRLAEAIQVVATKNGCVFLDAARVAHVGEDGLHMAKESNTPLANALFTIISAL